MTMRIKMICRAGLAIALSVTANGGGAAAQFARARPRANAALPGVDPLAVMLTSLKLRQRAKVGVVGPQGSCEAAEVSRLFGDPEMITLELAELAGPAAPTGCPSTFRATRVVWPWRDAGSRPPSGSRLDLLWLAGEYHKLSSHLSPVQLAAFARQANRVIAPGGALIVIDALASRAEGSIAPAAQDSVDPQLVLGLFEAAGFRLYTFGNSGPVTGAGSSGSATPGRRFAMIFRKVRALDSS